VVSEPDDDRQRRRELDADALVGSGEVAERLGRVVTTVHWWKRHDPNFPEPVAILGETTGRKTYVWYWPDVEEWARQSGRLPGAGDAQPE
jgi:hypothetical protein